MISMIPVLSRPWGPAVRLLMLVGLAHANIFGAGIIFDDASVIVGNPAIRTLWPLSSFQGLSVPEQYVRHVIHTRPVAMLNVALNYAVGGTEPAGYHLADL